MCLRWQSTELATGLRHLCSCVGYLGHRPRKRLGQNFLRDQSAIARILDCVDPQPGEHLAEPLLQRCASLGTPNVHNADALRFDFHTLIRDGQRQRLVGNLPYNISPPPLIGPAYVARKSPAVSVTGLAWGCRGSSRPAARLTRGRCEGFRQIAICSKARRFVEVLPDWVGTELTAGALPTLSE